MTTEEEQPTGEAPEEGRTLDELLRLESYEGMTDEEIERVISYRAEQAAIEAESEAKLEQQRARDAELINAVQANRDAAMIAFDEAKAVRAEFSAPVLIAKEINTDGE